MAVLGVDHMLVKLQGPRPVAEQIEEFGTELLPRPADIGDITKMS